MSARLCEDCAQPAGAHFSGKDCDADEREDRAAERRNECDGSAHCTCSSCRSAADADARRGDQ